jgi:hypothetical protein
MNQERKMRMQKKEGREKETKCSKTKNQSILFIILAHIFICLLMKAAYFSTGN